MDQGRDNSGIPNSHEQCHEVWECMAIPNLWPLSKPSEHCMHILMHMSNNKE